MKISSVHDLSELFNTISHSQSMPGANSCTRGPFNHVPPQVLSQMDLNAASKRQKKNIFTFDNVIRTFSESCDQLQNSNLRLHFGWLSCITTIQCLL